MTRRLTGWLLFALIAVTVLIAAAACSDPVGTYQLDNSTAESGLAETTGREQLVPKAGIDGWKFTLELREDQGCTKTWLIPGVEKPMVDQGTWKRDGDEIEMTFDGDPEPLRALWDGDSIVLRYAELNFTLQRT